MKYFSIVVTRSEDEFKAGHPAGAINIPYMFKVGSGNWHFFLSIISLQKNCKEIRRKYQDRLEM